MQSRPYNYLGRSILIAVGLSAATQLWAQSPIPNPAVRRAPIQLSETIDKDKTVAINDSETTVEKPHVNIGFSGKRFGTENEKNAAVVSTSGTGPLAPKKKAWQPDPDGWQFGFAPYLFASGIRGTVGARGRTLEIDSSFGSVLENLDFGLMGTFEAKKGRFVLLNDFIWTRMSADRDTPGGLFTNAKVGVNLVIFDPEAGYRVVEEDGGSLDILGGVRIWSVNNTLTVTSGIQPGFGASERKTFVAPVVGLRGVLNLSPRFFLSSKVDVGAGSGTDLTSQFFGGAGFKIKPTCALVGGYRYLQVDHDDNSGFIFDTRMSGLIFGMKFIF